MKDFINFSNDKMFLEDVSLLRALENSLPDKDKKKKIICLRKKIFSSIRKIFYELLKLSDDKIVSADGTIDIQKFNIYFELAVELKEKILIPRKITIEQYIESINKTCILSK